MKDISFKKPCLLLISFPFFEDVASGVILRDCDNETKFLNKLKQYDQNMIILYSTMGIEICCAWIVMNCDDVEVF